MRKFFFDVKAFLIIRKEVRKHRSSPDWERFNLRHDWLYRIYTVMNPNQADKGDDDNMITMKTMDRILPISKYIANLGLSEIVAISVERVPETNSFLVVYYQIFKWFTPWKLVSRLLIGATAITLLAIYWDELFSIFR